MPSIPYRYQVIGAEDVKKAQDSINKSMNLSAEQAKLVTKELENMRKASEATAARGLAAEALEKGTGKLKEFSDAAKGVARDIDAVAGESSAKFGKFVSDVAGVAEALGTTGRLVPAIALTSAAVGLFAKGWEKVSEMAKRAEKEATAAAVAIGASVTTALDLGRESAEYEEALRTGGESIKENADALRQESNAREKQISILKEELKSRKETQAVLDASMKFGDSLAPKRARELEIAEMEKSIRQAETARDIKDEEFRLKSKSELRQNDLALQDAQGADKMGKDNAIQEEQLALFFRVAAIKRKKNDDDIAAEKRGKQELIAQDIAEEIRHRQFIMQMEIDDAKREEDVAQRISDARVDIRRSEYDTDFTAQEQSISKREAATGRSLIREREALLRSRQAIADAEDRAAADAKNKKTREQFGDDADNIIATDNRVTQAKIQNRKAVTDATIANMEQQASAEQEAMVKSIALQQAETARAAAVMIAQPIFDEMLNSERELLNVNRDTWQAYKSQDWAAVIAAKVQAILAGIAVEATAKTVMESGESLASFGAALGFAAIGDIPSATAAAGAGAQHAASAAVFATIAGTTGGAAIGVGAARGQGGLVASGEKTAKDKLIGGGSDRSSSGGARGGSISGQTGGTPDVYVNQVFMPGAFLADTRAGVSVLAGMISQQSEFDQRANSRRP